MNVAGQHHGVFYFCIGNKFEHAPVIGFVAGPLIHAETFADALFVIDARHHHLLRENIPRLVGAAKIMKEPIALAPTHDRAFRAQAVRAGSFVPVTARLIRAVLARVHDKEVGDAAVIDLAEELHVGTVRE